MALDDLLVLRCVASLPDGPALTPDGRVLNLDEEASAVFFPHGKGSASGNERSISLKARHRLARLAEERIAGSWACAIDAAGAVHGSLACRDVRPWAVQRAKLFHRKRQGR